MPSAKAWMAASISLEFWVQLSQQLWNSSRKRTTKRESAGVSRLILERAAEYAMSMSPSAKNGDCGVFDDDTWQRLQYSSSTG